MVNVSLILRSKGEELSEYIKALAPLFDIEDLELILITEPDEVINIKKDYIRYSFSEDYRGFKNFCFASSLGKKVIIIEDGIVITPEIVSKIKELIFDNDYLNIQYNRKKYLNIDKTMFFTHEDTLIYNRGIKGFNKNSSIVIEDISLIDSSIDLNIQKLLDGGFFRELFTWYEGFILNKDNKCILNFYNSLELEKSFLDCEKRIVLDDIFYDKCMDGKYINYLRIKKMIIDDKPLSETLNAINSTNFSCDDIYYSWIIEEAIIRDYHVFKILLSFDKEILITFLKYLLNKSPYFKSLLYELIIQKRDSNDNVELYLMLIEVYIDFMSVDSGVYSIKEKLLELFEIYINAAFNCQKHEFIEQVVLARKDIEENRIDKGIAGLKEIKALGFSNVILHYIQRLRYEYNYYPYVLSICMIVKDEIKNIERCIKSLLPIIDSGIAELIIVDTGSKDGTYDIAKKYTDRLYSYPWDGDFSRARNYSISLSEGKYIFVMDADEEFMPQEIQKLIDEFSNPIDKEFNTYTFKIVNYTDIELKEYALLTQQRIFKNDCRFYYSSSVHNQPVFSNPVKNLDILIHHYGYIMTPEVKERKFNRTATMLKKELEKNPENIYYRFQLSTSYAMHGDGKEALYNVELYLREIKGTGQINENHLMYLNNAASIYIGSGMLDEALLVCDKALEIAPDFIDFIFYKGSILFQKKEYEKAKEYIKKYISKLYDFYELDISHDGRYSFYTLLFRDDALKMMAVICNINEDYKECIEYAAMINDYKVLKNCLHSVVNSFIKASDYNGLSQFFKEKIENEELVKIFWILVSIYISKKPEENKEGLCTFEVTSKDYLYLIDRYNIPSMEDSAAIPIFSRLLDDFLSYAPPGDEIFSVFLYKKYARYLLYRAGDFKGFKRFCPDILCKIFKKYMDLSAFIINSVKAFGIEEREKNFLNSVSDGLIKFQSGDKIGFKRLLRASVKQYRQMEGIVEVLIGVFIKDNKYEDDKHEYLKGLKERLSALKNGEDIERIRAIFDEYNREEFYTPDIFFVKSLIYMADNLFDEAKKTLLNGLKIYPNDISILESISKLYAIKGDYKKHCMYYTKAKLLKMEFGYDNCEKLLKISKANDDKLKVLIGCVDVTGVLENISNELKKMGIYARTINYYPANRAYTSDFIMDVNIIDSVSDILYNSTDAAARLISEFDVFHFNFGTTLTFHNHDLELLLELKKRVLMNFWGNDVRMQPIAGRINPYFKDIKTKDDAIRKNIEHVAKYVSACIVPDYEVFEYVKDYFKKVYIIPPMIDVKKYRPFIREPGKRIKIIHAPRNPKSKGSRYIIKAVENLKSKYNIDFDIIQGLPHDAAIDIYRNSDIIIDQLIVGSYGNLSIEAMALGKPVICYISDFMKEKYPTDLPIISANPDNIEEKLEFLIKNKDMLPILGKRGTSYIQNYHTPDKIIPQLINIYPPKGDS